MKNEVLIIHPTITKKILHITFYLYAIPFSHDKKLYNIIGMRNRESFYIVCSHI